MRPPVSENGQEEVLRPWPIPQIPPAVALRVCRTSRPPINGCHRSKALSEAAEIGNEAAEGAENVKLSSEEIVTGYGTSGSDHDPSSVCLFAMVHEFLENDGSDSHGFDIAEALDTTGLAKDCSEKDVLEPMARKLQKLARCADSFEVVLLDSVQKILESLNTDVGVLRERENVATRTHSCIKRQVMTNLRQIGYNAALCKTKWDHFCGVPAGDYEYIDVQFFSDGLQAKQCERIIVDVNFHSHFTIARPTEEFQNVCEILPPTFVGRPDRLKRIVSIMSDAIKHSLKVKGLHVPPWRKPVYMKAKWFGPYKRTSNPTSSRSCNEGGNVDHIKAVGSAFKEGGLNERCNALLETMHHENDSKARLGQFEIQHKLVGSSEREGDRMIAVATDWQPPAVEPRRRVLRKGHTATGLSSLLLQGASGLCNHPIVQVA